MTRMVFKVIMPSGKGRSNSIQLKTENRHRAYLDVYWEKKEDQINIRILLRQVYWQILLIIPAVMAIKICGSSRSLLYVSCFSPMPLVSKRIMNWVL